MLTIEQLKKIVIFLGGMGFYISNIMAKIVSKLGGLGIVSGVAPDLSLKTLLENGDENDDCRRALSHFPFPEIAKKVYEAYYVAPGTTPKNNRHAPFFTVNPADDNGKIDMANALCMCGAFVSVWLAKEGHTGPIGINLLEKISVPILPTLFGAILAKVDVVVVGAGMPNQIPDVIDAICDWREATYRINVGGKAKTYTIRFDPEKLLGKRPEYVEKPLFLAIVSSKLLAWSLVKKLGDRVNGFVVEGRIAGGHNAPPRRGGIDPISGEPDYTDEDQIDLPGIRDLGKPFWLAGGYASPEGLTSALEEHGANGIQIGTAFAFCLESGLLPSINTIARKLAYRGELKVRADPNASPTGYPIQFVELEGSLSEKAVRSSVCARCELGVLREHFEYTDGSIRTRCSAEPFDRYIAMGGNPKATKNVCCLCMGLKEASRLASGKYPPFLTLGKDAVRVARALMRHEDDTIVAEKVFDYVVRK